MSLTHRERIYAAINEPSKLDRPPVALWRHFPVDDQDQGTLAVSTIAHQTLYDWDLVKVTPASSFCLKDWGSTDIWEGNPEGTRRFTSYVINKPQDWTKLRVLDPRKSKYLVAQLNCLKMIRSSLPNEIPVIQTIFSPLSQAKNLVGKANLLFHIENYPEEVKAGLQVISETTQSFIEIIGQMGIDGIFFAVQHAQKSEMSFETYMDFGYRFDEISLAPAGIFWCNILHLHGKDIYFKLAQSYKSTFQVINWHDRETSPTLSEGKLNFPGCVCGGLSQNTIVFKNPADIISEIKDAFSQTFKNRFVLGTGCVAPIIAPHGNIMAIRNSVENEL